jgi:citrate lyase acyl carrier protein
VGVGEAGRQGDDVRSDLYANVDLSQAGDLNVTVDSKVAAFYGDAIAASAVETLKSLGVEHAKVSLYDKGALPFVVAARVETAARRAGVSGAAPPTRTVERTNPQAGRHHSRPGGFGTSSGEGRSSSAGAQRAAVRRFP